jgi:hypothetical protein
MAGNQTMNVIIDPDQIPGYKPIAKRNPRTGEFYIGRTGRVEQAKFDFKLDQFVILQPVDEYGNIVGAQVTATSTPQGGENNREWMLAFHEFIQPLFQVVPGATMLQPPSTPHQVPEFMHRFMHNWGQRILEVAQYRAFPLLAEPQQKALAQLFNQEFSFEECLQPIQAGDVRKDVERERETYNFPAQAVATEVLPASQTPQMYDPQSGASKPPETFVNPQKAEEHINVPLPPIPTSGAVAVGPLPGDVPGNPMGGS